MILRHPGISPTNDLVDKKIFSNPEITCQFIRSKKAILIKVTNTSHQYMLSQSWIAITSQMIWLFIALVCARTRQVRF